MRNTAHLVQACPENYLGLQMPPLTDLTYSIRNENAQAALGNSGFTAPLWDPRLNSLPFAQPGGLD